jgi:nucleotide-binding universal stress UspA family protein
MIDFKHVLCPVDFPAFSRRAHLIVMGVHGRNPIDLLLFGSTTQHVVRAAACPVLTLRRKPGAESRAG